MKKNRKGLQNDYTLMLFQSKPKLNFIIRREYITFIINNLFLKTKSNITNKCKAKIQIPCT